MISQKENIETNSIRSGFSNRRFQMNVRVLKIPPVFDDPKVFLKGKAYLGLSPEVFRKKLHYNFPEMRGGDEGRLDFFQKFI